MNDQEISQVVTQILTDNLADQGFERANAISEIDFDGGSIIRVTAHYKDIKVPSDDIIKSLHEIRDVLISKGEERFVILQSDYQNDPENQNAEEVED